MPHSQSLYAGSDYVAFLSILSICIKIRKISKVKINLKCYCSLVAARYSGYYINNKCKDTNHQEES